MKAEYLVGAAIGLFVFGYILDWLSPVGFVINNPFEFLEPEMLSKYPFTAVSVGAKTLGIFIISVVAILMLFGKKYIASAITLFVIAALMELYAIQQLATQSRLVSVQWNLGIAFAGVTLIVPSVAFLLLGVVTNISKNLRPEAITGGSTDEENEKKEESEE